MSATAPAAATTDVASILEQIKSLNTMDLLKVASAATTLAAKNVKKAPTSAPTSAPSKKGKKTKAASKKSDVSEASDASDAVQVKPKRSGSQLVKPRAWVTYVLQDAKTHGWSAFTISQSKKDKVTGTKTETVLEVPASAAENEDGEYVFPDGKKFNHKYAMSLSKLYWSVKTQSGSRKDLYDAFDASYVPPADASASATATEAEEDD